MSDAENQTIPADEPEAHQPQAGSTGLGARLARWAADPKAPVVAGAALLILLGLVAWSKFAPASFPSLKTGPDIVVFDPVRFINAQRAAASILAVNPNNEIALSLTQVAKQAEAVIKEEAGGSVVLVKQAVVGADGLPDITNKVLERFGLPTNVPTISTSPQAMSLESMAPTDNAFSPGKVREDYRLELSRQNDVREEAQGKAARQSNVLP